MAAQFVEEVVCMLLFVNSIIMVALQKHDGFNTKCLTQLHE